MSSDNPSVKIEESWKRELAPLFEKPYFQHIKQFLLTEKQAGKIIYPRGGLIFNAFNLTPFDAVKVVILGQDPYHNPNEAMGLCFSVPRGVATPPSLKNIYKELQTNIKGFVIPSHGDLTPWAQQGVFLLNAMLTVEHGKAGSHAKIGWQDFTDDVIRTLAVRRTGLVFMLWGNFAKRKRDLIDGKRHYILEAPHPSPLAGGGFFGCRHFTKANELLVAQGEMPIDWHL